MTIRSISSLRPGTTACLTLGFAFAVEISQLFNLIDVLGLGASRLARVVLGNTFDYGDLAAYTAGCAIALCLDRFVEPHQSGEAFQAACLARPIESEVATIVCTRGPPNESTFEAGRDEGAPRAWE